MRYTFRNGDTLHEAEVAPLGAGRYRVTVNGAAFEVHAERRGPALDLITHEGLVRAWVSRDGARRFVSAPGVGEAVLEKVEGRRASRGERESPDLTSPMPGKVVRVLVSPGDTVAKGQALVVVEAMKTELTIAAPRAGRIARVGARAGEKCDAGQMLVELEPLEQAAAPATTSSSP